MDSSARYGLLSVFAFMGCMHLPNRRMAEEEPPIWLDLEPGSVEFCLSSFPDGSPLRRAHRDLPLVRDALRAGEISLATERLEVLSERPHPIVEVHLVVTDLLERRVDRAWQRIEGLLEIHRDDACLLQLAAMTRVFRGELDEALSFAERAIELSGGDAEIRFLRAVILTHMGRTEDVVRALQEILVEDPTHEGAAAMLVPLLTRRFAGEADEERVLSLLEVAFAGGVDVSERLADSYYRLGRMGDYVRVASWAEWPLGDEGLLADSVDPMEGLSHLLGVGSEELLLAEFVTTLGSFECELLWDEAPVTVANFVGLATGRISWHHPDTALPSMEPLYDGTIIHRVVPGLLIRGGDPTGSGSGGPGYAFADESYPTHRFDEPGILAMANQGPRTNGSQWFITVAPAPHLNGRYTIFGRCDASAIEHIRRISSTPVDDDFRPLRDVELRQVRISGQ